MLNIYCLKLWVENEILIIVLIEIRNFRNSPRQIIFYNDDLLDLDRLLIAYNDLSKSCFFPDPECFRAELSQRPCVGWADHLLSGP